MLKKKLDTAESRMPEVEVKRSTALVDDKEDGEIEDEAPPSDPAPTVQPTASTQSDPVGGIFSFKPRTLSKPTKDGGTSSSSGNEITKESSKNEDRAPQVCLFRNLPRTYDFFLLIAWQQQQYILITSTFMCRHPQQISMGV